MIHQPIVREISEVIFRIDNQSIDRDVNLYGAKHTFNQMIRFIKLILNVPRETHQVYEKQYVDKTVDKP